MKIVMIDNYRTPVAIRDVRVETPMRGVQVVTGLWVSRSMVMTKALITANSKWEKTTQQLQRAVCEVQIYILSSRENPKLLGWNQMVVFINVRFEWFMCRLWTDLSWFNLMEAIKVM